MKYKSYQDLSNDVYENIHKLQGCGYDLVVGIPRSGMIPAYMIALLLNICCIDLNSFLSNSKVGRGSTRKISKILDNAWDAKKVLLVDDSLKTGGSMQEAVKKIENSAPHKVTRLAVYVEKLTMNNVDTHLVVLPGPRIYQWNLFHHSIINRTCMELEGILCAGPTPAELQGEEAYLAYLSEAKPLVLPTHKIKTILTNRSEKYREQTMRWLNKHNIQCERLVMCEANSVEKKENAEPYVSYKSDYYKASQAILFIENGEVEARRMAELSGKPVLCLEKGVMIQPGVVSVAKHGKQHFVKTTLRKGQRRFFLAMPESTKYVIRNFYHKLVRKA